ncbi:MAG: cytochrome c, partial [Pseudomonadota bacterium]
HARSRQPWACGPGHRIIITYPAIAEFNPSERGPRLGQERAAASASEIIDPRGLALPQGSGSVADGRRLFSAMCVSCHGARGRGGVADELAGGATELTSEHPDKTIGTYWPFATTLFDFIRRAMPMTAPGSLSDQQVYALTAYLLHENELLGPDDSLDARTLKAIRMPNRGGFVQHNGPPIEGAFEE